MTSGEGICGVNWHAFWRSSITAKFGFHGEIVRSGTELLSEFGRNENALRDHNIWTAVGMIPVIGWIIAGIRDIAIGLEKQDGERDWLAVGKGAGRIFLSPLVPIIDIVVTAGRYFTGTASTGNTGNTEGHQTY